jgi:hypothetical protein
MESFDTKIDHFSGLNLSQHQLFLSKLESSNPLSLPKRKKEKKGLAPKCIFKKIIGAN